MLWQLQWHIFLGGGSTLLFSGSAVAGEAINPGNWEYTVDDDGNATIKKYMGAETTVVIPEKIDEHTVIAIGEKAFEGNEYITSVTVPDCVTKIGTQAFKDCTSLTTAVVPKCDNFGSTGIFTGDYKLTTLTVPGNFTWSDMQSGGGDRDKFTNLTTITITKGEPKSGSYGFQNITSLKNLTIAEGVTAIPNNWFTKCTALCSVTLPTTLEEIGDNAFSSCTRLTEITIPNGVTKIGQSAFNASGLTGIVLPDGVTEIGLSCFRGCENLKTAVIPSSVTKFGTATFGECYALEAVTLPGNFTWSYFSTNTSNMNSYVNLKELTIAPGTTAVSNSMFQKVPTLEKIVISDGVTSIGDYAFRGNSGLKTLVLPESLTSIGISAFAETGLEEVEVPDSVTSIGDSVFSNCTALKIAILPGAATIGKNIFNGSTAIEKLAIPGETLAKTIIYDSYTAATISTNYPNLKEIIVASGSKQVINSFLKGFTTVKKVTVSGGVTTISANAFMDCTSLEEVIIPSGVTTFGAAIFKNDYALAKMQIPANFTWNGMSTDSGTGEKDKYAALKEIIVTAGEVNSASGFFRDVKAIEKVIFMEGVTSIRNNAFTSCENLEELTIPTTVTTIGEHAFESCTSLTKIKFSEGLKEIGASAFKNCTGLENIGIPSGVTTIGNNTFNGCASLEKIEVPEGVTSIGINAFANCDNLNEAVLPSTFTEDKTNSYSLFSGDYNLTSLTVPGNITDFGTFFDSANKNSIPKKYAKLTDLIIADGTESIVENFVNGYTNFTKLTIPATVTAIGENAFNECNSIEDVYYGDTMEAWGKVEIDESNVRITEMVTIHCTDGDIVHIHEFLEYEIETPATCTEKGVEVSVCKCGSVDERPIEALGHDFDEPQYVWADDCATCTATRTCKREGCEGTESETVETTITENTPATCTTEGENIYKATFENEVFDEQTTTKTLETLAHDFDEWVIEKEATCTKDGKENRKCKNCNETEQRDITAIGHTAVSANNAISVTCTTDGRESDTVCSVCNETLEIGKVIPKTGHTAVSANNAIPATCTKDGRESDTVCSVCGETLEIGKVIPKTGHNFGEASYTWTDDFKSCTAIRTCPVCKVSESENATITSETTDASYTADGHITYKATFKNSAFATQTKTKDIAKLTLQKSASLSASAQTNTSISLKWSKVSGADGYIIEQLKGRKWVAIKTITKAATVKLNVTKLKAGTQYKFRVCAYKGDVKSDYTSVLTSYTNPSNVTNFKVGKKTKNSLTLTWKKNTTAQGYILEQKTGKKWITIKTINNKNTTSFKITKLKKKTQYTFRITAYKKVGSTTYESAYATVSGKTK